MDNLFPTIDLDAADQSKLRALRDKEVGLQQFVSMMQATGEQRAEQLVAQGREVWQGIATKHKLDIEHINYVPNDDFTKLMPKLVKL